MTNLLSRRWREKEKHLSKKAQDFLQEFGRNDPDFQAVNHEAIAYGKCADELDEWRDQEMEELRALLREAGVKFTATALVITANNIAPDTTKKMHEFSECIRAKLENEDGS